MDDASRPSTGRSFFSSGVLSCYLQWADKVQSRCIQRDDNGGIDHQGLSSGGFQGFLCIRLCLVRHTLRFRGQRYCFFGVLLALSCVLRGIFQGVFERAR